MTKVRGRVKAFSLNDFSSSIANKITLLLGLDNAKKEIIQYGLSVLLVNVLGLAAVLIIAYLIGILVPTLAIASTLVLMRPNAGGAHCHSPLNCNMFGLLFMPLLGYAVVLLTGLPERLSIIYLLLAFSVAVTGIHKNAPYFTRDKPRAARRMVVLKRRSFLLAGLLFIASGILFVFDYASWSIGLATGLLWQGLMLMPAGIGIVHALDRLFSRVFYRKGGDLR